MSGKHILALVLGGIFVMGAGAFAARAFDKDEEESKQVTAETTVESAGFTREEIKENIELESGTKQYDLERFEGYEYFVIEINGAVFDSNFSKTGVYYTDIIHVEDFFASQSGCILLGVDEVTGAVSKCLRWELDDIDGDGLHCAITVTALARDSGAELLGVTVPFKLYGIK